MWFAAIDPGLPTFFSTVWLCPSPKVNSTAVMSPSGSTPAQVSATESGAAVPELGFVDKLVQFGSVLVVVEQVQVVWSVHDGFRQVPLLQISPALHSLSLVQPLTLQLFWTVHRSLSHVVPDARHVVSTHLLLLHVWSLGHCPAIPVPQLLPHVSVGVHLSLLHVAPAARQVVSTHFPLLHV